MEPPAFPVVLLQAKERWSEVPEVGLAPGPHHRCQEKAETLSRPCWEGAVPEQVQSQPLDPFCQHLRGGARALFLSSILLIHTLARCCGATSSPLPPPSNEFSHQNIPTTLCLPLRVKSSKYSCRSDPRRTNTIVVLTQALSSAGHDKVPPDLNTAGGANTTTLPSAFALSPVATRQRGSAV